MFVQGRVMEIEATGLSGVVVITPNRIEDARGFFCESWNSRTLAAHGIPTTFAQDNHSVSYETGTLRGLHFQAPPMAQAKLVRCGQGALFDVAVDVRRHSPTYGHWVGYELSAENGRQLFIPEGFLHGFITRIPNTEIIYKCSNPYDSETEGAVAWDSCGIEWGNNDAPLLSYKDAQAAPLSGFKSPFDWATAA